MQVRNEVKELRLLFEVLQILDSASDLSDNLETVLEVMAEHTGMMRGVITLLDEAHGEIAIEAAYGMSAEAQSKGRYKLGEGITGKVIESGKPLVIPNVLVEPLFLNRTGSRSRKEAVSFICVPVKMEGRVIGALSADRLFAASEALEEDMRLLSVLASLISKAVKNRQERHRMLEENRRLLDVLRERSRPGNVRGALAGAAGRPDAACTGGPDQRHGPAARRERHGQRACRQHHPCGQPRAGHPFIKINCAALPEGLIESELFGHEKGAFTGAVGMRKGRFEAADGGTLFLDEIGELAVSTQVKLLRVLQEQEFERLGGMETRKVDVRVVAATSRNLEQMVKDGLFRRDLYYRLNVFPVSMPPLRERQGDIPLLVENFLEKYGHKIGKRGLRVAPEAEALLLAHSWPGNIRELENVIERAVILTTDGLIRPDLLPPAMQAPCALCSLRGTLPDALEQLERQLITEALQEHRGNMGHAAQALGISERVMGLRMRKFGLGYKAFRRGAP